MAKHAKSTNGFNLGIVVEIKSKFDAEFRRFSVDRSKLTKCDDFYQLVEGLHKLHSIPFLITYTDGYGDQLPINNDGNYTKALDCVKGVLRLQLQRKGETPVSGYGTLQMRNKKNPITKLMTSEPRPAKRPQVVISYPEDFRRVSAIIDVDIVPETHRRVRLMKNGSDKPLGFYIRDGVSVRVTPNGLEKVPGIFISRLVPGGLAESTGLLAVNDEVLEVNGIEVTNKTLDQVTDMMVANSSNLIITVKPVNQSNTLASRHHHLRQSRVSNHSHQSGVSIDSGADDTRDYYAAASSPPGSTGVTAVAREEDEDEVCEHDIRAGGSSAVDRSGTGEDVDDDGELLTL